LASVLNRKCGSICACSSRNCDSVARRSASTCLALVAKKWWKRKVIITDINTVPTMMLLPARLPIHTVMSEPANCTPSGQPSTTPIIGRPEKKTVRCQFFQRATRSGVANHSRVMSKSRWMTTPIVRLTVRFLPYQ